MPKINELHDRANAHIAIDLSMKTADLLKWAHATLKSKGFERIRASTASAMFDWKYQRGTRYITLDGWHGTGKKGTCRNFGDLKLCFSLYDNEKSGLTDDNKYNPALRLDIRKDDVPAAIRFMSDVRDYIGALK